MSDDWYKMKRTEVFRALTIPVASGAPMREMVEAQIEHLVSENNLDVHARLEYLATGEVTRESVRDVVPYIDLKNHRQVAYARQLWSAYVITPPATEAMSDAELLASYGELLLKLREQRLPDRAES